jgi:uncharacterized protein YndB with AHSA1/START domain
VTEPTPTPQTLVVERLMPHRAEKIWRALTQGPLIEEWLMANDFAPIVGHCFTLRSAPSPHWNGVLDCEVLTVEPGRCLAYTWNASDIEARDGLKTVVIWTLQEADGSTLVRMEQSGFRPQDAGNLQGANYGWQKFFAALQRVVGGLS